MPEWRNWQTHTTQNRAGNHVGSSPTLGTRNKNVVNATFFYFSLIVGLEKEAAKFRAGLEPAETKVTDIRTQLLKFRKREGLKMKKNGKECRKNVKIL